MPYVMVPVPEEHVSEVLRLVLRLAGDGAADSVQPWDEDAITQLYAETSEPARALLSFLAHPTRAGKELRPKDVADGLHIEQSDVAGIIGPLNRHCHRVKRPPPVESRSVTVTSRLGKPVRRRTLVMHDDIAKMVRAAEQQHRGRRRAAR